MKKIAYILIAIVVVLKINYAEGGVEQFKLPDTGVWLPDISPWPSTFNSIKIKLGQEIASPDGNYSIFVNSSGPTIKNIKTGQVELEPAILTPIFVYWSKNSDVIVIVGQIAHEWQTMALYKAENTWRYGDATAEPPDVLGPMSRGSYIQYFNINSPTSVTLAYVCYYKTDDREGRKKYYIFDVKLDENKVYNMREIPVKTFERFRAKAEKQTPKNKMPLYEIIYGNDD